MLKSTFFKDIFQQNFKVQKSVFMKYVIVDHRLYVCTVYIAVVYAAVYILVQSKEEYSLIWKAKPLTVHIDKGKR